MTILVKGGEIDLYVLRPRSTREHTLVLPTGYGMCHYVGDDDYGKSLGNCALFFGPIIVTNERVEEVPKEASRYFGDDYDARKALLDIPDGKWNPHGHVVEIIYYRPGRYAADWKHEFAEPVPLFKQGRWWKLKLPKDCSVTYRGIERP